MQRLKIGTKFKVFTEKELLNLYPSYYAEIDIGPTFVKGMWQFCGQILRVDDIDESESEEFFLSNGYYWSKDFCKILSIKKYNYKKAILCIK